MGYWWVSQKKKVDEEHGGGYLWAPVTSARGRTRYHWQYITRVQRGDMILCYVNQEIVSVAVAQGEAYRSPRPSPLPTTGQGEKDGWRIDVAYDPVEPPLPIAPLADRLVRLLPDRYSPLTKDGIGVGGYLFPLPPEVGELLVRELERDHPAETPTKGRSPRPYLIPHLGAVLRHRRRDGSRNGACSIPALVHRSPQARRIEDRAEAVVYEWLRDHLPEAQRSSLRWPARDGQQLGWDIEYVEDKRHVAVEVKGTTSGVFSNIDITASEWHAAQEMGDDYWLYLVANCMAKAPRIHRLQNPFHQHETGTLCATPLLWRLEFAG